MTLSIFQGFAVSYSAIYDYFTGMKQLSFIVLIAVVIGCGSKQESKERTIYNKEFNWTMTVPAGFDSMTKEELDEIHESNSKAGEETYDMEGGDMGDNLFGFRRKKSTLFLPGGYHST